MRSNRSIPKLVYPQLRELESDAIVQFARKFHLRRIRGVVVNMDIETAARAVRDRRGEGVVCGAGAVAGGGRYKRFSVGIDATGRS
jgi:hypothetical protein